MSEWVSVLAVFWILWAVDGARLAPRRIFTLIGRGGGRGHKVAGAGKKPSPLRRLRGRVYYDRLSLPGVLPGSWRVAASDVPLALSPAGFCNRLVGAAGRPAERIAPLRAWLWEDVREVGVAKGWIYVNGVRCCANTGHVRADELLALARLAAAERERRIQAVIARWFRPTHLTRRAQVLVVRTRGAAAINRVVAAVFAVLTGYLIADVPSRIPERWGSAVVNALPWLLLAVVVAHVAAVIMAWRAVRRLKAVAGEKRGTALFSALMLPAQALRLRSLAGDGFFPAQHPATLVAAFGRDAAKREWFFNALADLRWPLPERDEPALAREVAAWFAAALQGRIGALVRASGMEVDQLLAAPRPDGPASCAYCPRCGDQFVGNRPLCPHGIALRPLCVGGGEAIVEKATVCADDRGIVR